MTGKLTPKQAPSKVLEKSRSPNLKGGSRKGIPNKTTALLKDAILQAAEDVGEDGNGKAGLTGYLRTLARGQPKAFAGLLGKVMPTQVTGEGGGPLVFERIVREIIEPK